MQACKKYINNILANAQCPIKNSNHGFITSKINLEREWAGQEVVLDRQTEVIKGEQTQKVYFWGLGMLKIKIIIITITYYFKRHA